MENNSSLPSEDNGKHLSKNQQANNNAEKPRNKDLSSQFDPSLSSREMRKIKYYEDMFARMAHESKNGMHSNSLGQSLFKNSSSKSARSRGSSDKKHSVSEPKDHTSNSYQENTLLDSNAFSKTSRAHTYKKDSYRNSGDKGGLHSRDKHEVGGVTASDSAHTSSKTLLENKRLIKVQSMPMVTKKKKIVLETKSNSHEPTTPATSEVSGFKETRNDVGMKKMDLEVTTRADVPKSTPTVHEFTLNKALVKSEDSEVLSDNVERPKHTLKIEHSIDIDGVDDLMTPKGEMIREPSGFQEMADDYFVEPNNQIPLNHVESVTDVSYESPILPLEQEEMQLYDGQVDQYIDETLKGSKKKSARGRKGKSKRIPKAKEYSSEVFVDDKTGLDNDFVQTPILESELMELQKPIKTRLKSQRSLSRKKKQDEQNVADLKTVTRNTKFVNRTVNKQLFSASRSNTSGSTDRLHIASGNRLQLLSDLSNSDESYFNVDYLRIITADEAEKIINMCSQHCEDIEKLKNLVSSAQLNLNVIESLEKEGMMNKCKRREFILDPKHIVAPVLVDGQSQSHNNDQLPQNPLHISFKYRFFKDLDNI